MSSEEGQRYRSQIRIFHDVIQILQETPDVKITHLIHKANLPYDRLNEHLEQMKRRGLIEIVRDGERTKYLVTKKGERFLAEFHHMEGWANAFGLDL